MPISRLQGQQSSVFMDTKPRMFNVHAHFQPIGQPPKAQSLAQQSIEKISSESEYSPLPIKNSLHPFENSANKLWSSIHTNSAPSLNTLHHQHASYGMPVPGLTSTMHACNCLSRKIELLNVPAHLDQMVMDLGKSTGELEYEPLVQSSFRSITFQFFDVRKANKLAEIIGSMPRLSSIIIKFRVIDVIDGVSINIPWGCTLDQMQLYQVMAQYGEVLDIKVESNHPISPQRVIYIYSDSRVAYKLNKVTVMVGNIKLQARISPISHTLMCTQIPNIPSTPGSFNSLGMNLAYDSANSYYNSTTSQHSDNTHGRSTETGTGTGTGTSPEHYRLSKLQISNTDASASGVNIFKFGEPWGTNTYHPGVIGDPQQYVKPMSGDTQSYPLSSHSYIAKSDSDPSLDILQRYSTGTKSSQDKLQFQQHQSRVQHQVQHQLEQHQIEQHQAQQTQVQHIQNQNQGQNQSQGQNQGQIQNQGQHQNQNQHQSQSQRVNRSQTKHQRNAISSSTTIDLNAIQNGTEKRTTVMVCNIPNKLEFDDFKKFVDETNKNTYEFLYLRFDFSNRCNVGYAFISFTEPQHLKLFVEKRTGMKWNSQNYNSEKVIDIKFARIQGRESLIRKFRSSPVMHQEPAFRPRFYATKGPLAGKEIPFTGI